MRVLYLQCVRCKLKYTASKPQQRCGCGGSVVVNYDWQNLHLHWKTLRRRPFNHWRYQEFYPDIKDPIEMGEGGTPVVSTVKSTSWHFKIEGQNPTGSFKDRGSAIEVSLAREEGSQRLVLASTGNMGASVAAYCARAGLDCEVVLPKSANPEKIAEIRSFGAKITPVQGDYTKAAAQAVLKAKKADCTLAGDYTFRREGEKSIAFELIDQLGELDYIVVPVGNGTMISGIWKGLKELYAAHLLRHLPKLIAVQAAGCMPIVTSITKGTPIKPVIPKTIASAVACGNPLDGDLAITAIKESNGLAVAVTDSDILAARKRLAHEEGLDTEPSGATSLAGALKLRISPKSRTAFVLSGSGLKDLKNL